MSMAFMRALVERDLPAAEAEIGAIVPDDLPDQLDNFLQFRIADLSIDPAAQPWLGRAIVLTEADGTRRIIGSCGFHSPPEADGRVEVGYRVEPPTVARASPPRSSGRCSTGHTAQGVDRFRASVSPGNVASLAIIAQFGFRRSGSRSMTSTAKELVFELDGWPPTG